MLLCTMNEESPCASEDSDILTLNRSFKLVSSAIHAGRRAYEELKCCFWLTCNLKRLVDPSETTESIQRRDKKCRVLRRKAALRLEKSRALTETYFAKSFSISLLFIHLYISLSLHALRSRKAYFFIIHSVMKPKAADRLPCRLEEKSKCTNRPWSQSCNSVL